MRPGSEPSNQNAAVASGLAADADEGLRRKSNEPTRASLVSLIIPCYNQAYYLAEAIESALAQTHPSVEIVVVNDGSTDETFAVAAQYSSVRSVRQSNQGLPAARNAGWRESRGEFLKFLDADDRLTPNAVEAHLRCFAENPAAGWVVGDIDRIDEAGVFTDSPRWPLLTSDFYEELLRVNHVANTIAVMFRRVTLEEMGGFDSSLLASEDYEALLRAARVAPSAHHRDVVAQYRRYPNSMSRKAVLMLQSMGRVMDAQKKVVEENPRLKAAWREGQAYWRDLFGAMLTNDLIAQLRAGRFQQAVPLLLRLFQYGRGRILLWPWTHRQGIARRIRICLGLPRSRREGEPIARGPAPLGGDQ